MAISVASVVACSVCGEPLNAKGDCLACLLRTGLGESVVECASPASLVFGDFEIARREDGSLCELGHGAMGITYLAVDNVLRRKVALKVIDVPAAARGSQTVRERFLREARAAAVLRHPNVAAIYQFGASPNGSRCFYAMELVEGETLETRVRRDGPLNPKFALEIAIQIARALMAAAAQGLIHRDLKPANIMLTSGNAETAELEVKVIDFGLAKAIADAGGEMDLTHGEFVGTPNFASPEQFGSGPIDARSDIYSLGATLWFALTGLAPHPGSTIEEIRDHQTRDDLPVEQLAARKVPAPVIKLLRRLLAVDAAQRPASARELMEKLEFCRQQLSAGSGSGTFFSQLKERHVVRVAIAYGVTAWLLAQIATQVFPFFEIPSWGVRLVILLIVVGFPIALALAWAFELTPEGIKRTEDVDVSQSVRASRGRKLDFFIIGILLVVLGIFAYQRFGPQKKIPTADSSLPEKSIAVLPFENLSEEKANAYFADGIQGEILTKLAAIGDLKVISRSSTAKYKSEPKDLKTVARELGVANVLEGSVQRAGGKVRVNVQLLDARVDTHLWAKSYDRDLKDVFAVETEVAQEIADALRAKLSPSQTDALATAPTRDTEAYDLFLKGEYEERQAQSALTSELFDRAETFYRQALARDPNFALAYARLAYSQLFRHWLISNLTSAELAEVKSHIDRALAIAPALADAHLALAVFHYWGHRDYDPALRELDRVVELQPNNANAQSFYAAIYRRRGEWKQSLAADERAAELDPRDPQIPTDIGATCNSLRRWGDAEHAFRRALALDPHNALAAVYLARTYVNSAGDVRRAKQAYEGVPAESRTHRWLGQGVSTMIDERVYLDVLERHFADALKAWDTLPMNAPEERLRQLEARIGIQVIAGQGEVAKSECEQARALLEARLAERSEDRASMVALAWVYVCLGRSADAVRVAKQAADSLPVEKDALAGRILLNALAEIEARTGHAEEAVRILRQLLTAPAGNVISVARVRIDPVWDPIRNDSDFQKLISEPEPETVYK